LECSEGLSHILLLFSSYPRLPSGLTFGKGKIFLTPLPVTSKQLTRAGIWLCALKVHLTRVTQTSALTGFDSPIV
jgi:hypothetical protein